MAEEVKIQVRTESDTKALEATQAKIKELYQLAAKYEATGGMETAAKSVRSEAHSLEKDVARFKREQSGHEKEITHERREQAALNRAEATQQSGTGRMLFGGSRGVAHGLIGGTAAAALGFVLNEALTEASERQGIALRAAAQRTMDQRGLAIAGSWRGSSTQTLAQVQGLDDDIARQTANRTELERKADTGTLRGALTGAGAGAGLGASIGAGIGSIVPGVGTLVGGGIGAGLGTLIGGAVGAYHGHAEGEREKTEDTQTLAAKKKKREDLEAIGKRQVAEEDGALEMSIAKHRAERTMSGSRAVFADEQTKKSMHRKRELQGMGLSEEQANETVRLESQTALRDRQIAAGSGLVDARSGAGDIAAAARWAGQSTDASGVEQRLDKMITTMDGHSREIAQMNQKDMSVK